MTGMSRQSGRGLGLAEHLRQSATDILTTPVGSRVMRREYGSLLPYLIDAPLDQAMVIDIVQASALALGRWEPRMILECVQVHAVSPGHFTLTIDVRLRQDGQRLRLEGITV